MEEDFSWEDDLMTKSYKRQESHLAKYNFCFKKCDYLEGFLKIDNLCFELSHSIESSLRSRSTL